MSNFKTDPEIKTVVVTGDNLSKFVGMPIFTSDRYVFNLYRWVLKRVVWYFEEGCVLL